MTDTIAPVAGRFYADREGKIRGPIIRREEDSYASGRYPFEADNGICWCADGMYWSDLRVSELDLIREVTPDELHLRQLAETDDTAKHVLADWLYENGIEVTA